MSCCELLKREDKATAKHGKARAPRDLTDVV